MTGENVQEKRIAIYGAGAMGTVLGGLLTAGGLKNVHLITRNKAHVDGLNEKGAQIVCTAENEQKSIPVTALTPSQMTGKYDVVFLMTKQRSNAEILTSLLEYMHEDTIVCTTQNGLPERSVEKVVGIERTFGGVASFGATFIGGGAVELTTKFDGMRLQVAPLEITPKTQERQKLLLDILAFAGKAIGQSEFAKPAENLQGARWSKLCINAAFSGLSVVTGLTFGEIAKKRATKKLALGILRECMDVANALGVTLEKMQGHDMQKMLGGRSAFSTCLSLLILPIAMRRHKKLVSGMLKDVQNGKKCEIDFINGVVVERGKEAGVPTPLCQKVVEIVHGIENGLYEIHYDNTRFFNA